MPPLFGVPSPPDPFHQVTEGRIDRGVRDDPRQRGAGRAPADRHAALLERWDEPNGLLRKVNHGVSRMVFKMLEIL